MFPSTADTHHPGEPTGGYAGVMSNDDDFGTNDLDPQERRDAETFLDDPNDSDDEPWSPPDRQPRGAEFADIENETFEQRIAQEEPEAGTAYGDPDDESQVEPAIDDPDAVPPEQDFIGNPDEVDDQQPADDPTRSAEQSALHVIDDDQRFPAEEDVNGDSDKDTDYPG